MDLEDDVAAAGTAERGIMLALMALYRVKEHVRTIRSDVWKTYLGKPTYPYMGNCMYGKTVGIIGGGTVPAALIRRLKWFNLAKLMVSSASFSELATDDAEKVDQERLLAECDLVFVTTSDLDLLLPFDEAVTKPSCVLVCVDGGDRAVDAGRLCRALQSGRLRHAALEVSSSSPLLSLPAEHPIRTLNNCLLVPQMGHDMGKHK